MTSSPYSHTAYKITPASDIWVVFRDDSFLAGFATRSAAELFVLQMIQDGCAEGKASQVQIEDERGCERLFCRCFDRAPGTPLS